MERVRQMKKACIFDLDGTLANTLESMSYTANLVLKKFSLKELPTENFKYYCGNGADMLVQRCLLAAGDSKLRYLEEAKTLYRQLFAENSMYKVKPYPGITELLDELGSRGIRLGVCSNKPHEATVEVISQLFGQRFDMVVGQQAGLAKKPAPDSPLLIAKKLGVKPEECLYIGDTGTDMQTGTAAKMHTVGVLWGFRTEEELLENGCQTLAEKPMDIIKIWEELA